MRRKRQRPATRAVIKRHLIENPNGPDLEFDGTCLLEEANDCTGVVSVYRTKGGAIVASQFRDANGSDHPVARVSTLRSLDELANWLGYSRGAKSILEKLGRPARQWVD